MKIRAVLILASSLAFSAALAADSSTRLEKKPNPSKAPLALERGMSAEAVIKALGKPDTIKPMAAPEGKAETWTYRRLRKRETRPTSTSMPSRPAFGNTDSDTTQPRPLAMEPDLTFEYVETYRVISMLMFNDQLILAKQWEEERRDYR